MPTSLETKYLSGGFSVQRNEMISITQQKFHQRFQFTNKFNQTFVRLDKPAQGLGQDKTKQIDRVPPYELRSEERMVVNGSVTTIKKPLSYMFSSNNLLDEALLNIETIDAAGSITGISIASGGQGYSPSTVFNVTIRGGAPAGTNSLSDLKPAVVHAYTDGNGRVATITIVSGGLGYEMAPSGFPAISADIDLTPIAGNFVVERFNGPLQTDGIGAITAVTVNGTGTVLTGHRPGVWYIRHNSDHPLTTSGSGSLEGFKGQLYIANNGNVEKFVLFSYGEGFSVGDTITIPQSQIGGIAADTSSNQVVLSITQVASAQQVELDYGSAIWRTESFDINQDVVLQYPIDTGIQTDTPNGMLRNLATDLCLHPYANYYTSAFSTLQQGTATLTFTGAGLTSLTTGHTADIIATLTSPFDYSTLGADTGFQIEDVGKRIIEPYGDGTMVITDVGNDDGTGSAADSTRDHNPHPAGCAVCSMVPLTGQIGERTTEEVNTFSDPTNLVYKTKQWRLAIKKDKWDTSYDSGSATNATNHTGMKINEGGFEAQPYNLIYPHQQENLLSGVPIAINGQQNHRDVMSCIRRIGDLFVVESEKATDLLSSTNDINPSTTSIPTTVKLTPPVRDQRKPQKWRMRFYYDDRDEYIYVNVATPLQILDNGDMTSGQGRDGIKQGIFRQPGELSDIYFNFSNDNNKAKSGFFRRQGKTDSGIEGSYPMAYRLTCTDHGTGFFCYDQASVDQDDDYAWFVVQRHVNNVSGTIESEDGKTPVHCLYAPSKRPDETSNFNTGFFASVDTVLNPATGETVMTAKKLDELEIFDVNGRKLKPGIPLQSTIISNASSVPVRPAGYGSGQNYLAASSLFPLTDEAALGSGSSSGGFTTVNDFWQFPDITSSTYPENVSWANHTSAAASAPVTSPNDRNGFSLGYPATITDSYFVPVGDWITGFDAATRYTAADDTNGDVSVWSGKNTANTGIKNFVTARNQMQGPTRLGLRLSRVRHRSVSGVDTFLDPVKDFSFVTRSDDPARTNVEGNPRELSIASGVAVFHPTSAEALKLVEESSHTIIYYTGTQYLGNGAATVLGPNFDTTVYGVGTNYRAKNIDELFRIQKDIANGLTAGGPYSNAQAEIVPVEGRGIHGGVTQGLVAEMDGSLKSSGGSAGAPFEGYFMTAAGNPLGKEIILPKVGDEITMAVENAQTATRVGGRVSAILQTFPEDDQFIYEYAWEGAGFNNEYTNYYGRTGINSHPLHEVNRLKVFVDGTEADAAVLGQNYNIDTSGEIQFGTTTSSLEYFGSSKPMYAYNVSDDTLKFALPLASGSTVSLSYENYSDVEERDTGTNTYLIKIPEDRDVPDIWQDIHSVAKGIYRFIVRESDVFKPWDYHVSAVIPQVDSPACINPVEQLSITQDKTVIFNFPTPLASQRFIYSDGELDIICVANAGSSTQGGIIKTSESKYDLDHMQHSGYRNFTNDDTYPQTLNTTDAGTILSSTQFGEDANGLVTDANVSKSSGLNAAGELLSLNYRREYYWHNVYQGSLNLNTGQRSGATASTPVRAFDTAENSTTRTYLGMHSTKPFGNGMRIFIQCRGGSIRPEYSDFTPRDQVDTALNDFTTVLT
jgi:hypothetical protein